MTVRFDYFNGAGPKAPKDRDFIIQFSWQGFARIQFGFHIDLNMRNFEIHLPFCFLRIGYESTGLGKKEWERVRQEQRAIDSVVRVAIEISDRNRPMSEVPYVFNEYYARMLDEALTPVRPLYLDPPSE